MKVLIQKEQKAGAGIKEIKRLAREVLKDLGCRDNAELSILLTDNKGIQELNKRYLKKDKPTDVLSFSMYEIPLSVSVVRVRKNTVTEYGHGSRFLLGDIVISIETAKTQAKEDGVALYEEIARLLIHGILHLFGFDHEKSSKEAQRMKKEEERLLKIAKCKL